MPIQDGSRLRGLDYTLAYWSHMKEQRGGRAQ